MILESSRDLMSYGLLRSLGGRKEPEEREQLSDKCIQEWDRGLGNGKSQDPVLEWRR